MLYAIQQGDIDGPVKLGTALDPAMRLEALQTGNATDLHLLGVRWGGREQEARLHFEYRATHLRGEWFRATPALLAAVGDWFVGHDEVSRLSPAVAALQRVSTVVTPEQRLTRAHGRALQRHRDPVTQLLLAECSITYGWCARHLDRQVDEALAVMSFMPLFGPSPDYGMWQRGAGFPALEASWRSEAA